MQTDEDLDPLDAFMLQLASRSDAVAQRNVEQDAARREQLAARHAQQRQRSHGSEPLLQLLEREAPAAAEDVVTDVAQQPHAAALAPPGVDPAAHLAELLHRSPSLFLERLGHLLTATQLTYFLRFQGEWLSACRACALLTRAEQQRTMSAASTCCASPEPCSRTRPHARRSSRTGASEECGS